MHDPMGAHVVFVLYEPVIWGPITLEIPYWHDGIFPIQFSSTNQGPVLVILVCIDIFYHIPHKVQPIMLTCEFI